MPVTKCTMLLEVLTKPDDPNARIRRVGGWSESWYWDDVLSASKLAAFNELCQARANLLGLGGRVKGQRFQLVDPSGSAQTQGRVFASNRTEQTDQPGVALQLAIKGTGVTNVRRSHLRGIPDAMVKGGEWTPEGDFNLTLNHFLVKLSAWKFRARDLSQPRVLVNNITSGGVVTFFSDLALAVGDRVTFNKVQDTSGNRFRGTFRVGVASTLRQVTLIGWPYGDVTGGTAQKLVIIYPAMPRSGMVAEKISFRKVGRPFDQFRGRRSKR